MNNIAFLLGAGASIPAGYKSTQDLTNIILAPGAYSRCTDGKYYPDTAAPNTDYRTPVVCCIVEWLSKQIYEYYLDRDDPRDPNYEEIYFLASQLSDDSSELQNPAVLPLLRKLKCDMISWPEYKEYCDVYSQASSDPYSMIFNEFSKETCRYIEGIVINELSSISTQSNCKHLSLIKAIHQTDGLKLNGIATLAHDIHVERYLKNSGIQITDGFSPPRPNDSLRIWTNHFSDDESIPFVKLHGSVNWNTFHLREPDQFNTLPESEVGVCEQSCLENSIYHFEEDRENPSLLLIGTFNKPAQYSQGLMLDIHYRFRQVLSNTHTLIVCGYSFGDKAINTQLIFWYRAQWNRSIIVIDPRLKDKIIESARFAAGQLLQYDGVAHFIEKPMQDVIFEELIQILP